MSLFSTSFARIVSDCTVDGHHIIHFVLPNLDVRGANADVAELA